MEKILVESYERLKDTMVNAVIQNSRSVWDECVITKTNKNKFYDVKLYREATFETLCVNWYNKFRFVFDSPDFVFFSKGNETYCVNRAYGICGIAKRNPADQNDERIGKVAAYLRATNRNLFTTIGYDPKRR